MEQISQTSNLVWTIICIVSALFTAIATGVAIYYSLKGRQEAMEKTIQDNYQNTQSAITALADRKKSEIKRLEDQHDKDVRRLEEADKRLAEADKEIITLMNSRFDTVQNGIYKMVDSLGELKGEIRSRREG